MLISFRKKTLILGNKGNCVKYLNTKINPKKNKILYNLTSVTIHQIISRSSISSWHIAD